MKADREDGMATKKTGLMFKFLLGHLQESENVYSGSSARRLISVKRNFVSEERPLGRSDVIYVFLVLPHDVDRNFRKAGLFGRCLVARGPNQERSTAMGLATERYEEEKRLFF